MWYRAVRAFVITSLVLNAALVTAMASGLRPPSLLDFAACVALLFAFLNAVGDRVEAEAPVIREGKDLCGPTLHIIRQRGELGTEDAVGLDAFRSER
jgi:hypothetical protein